MNKDKVLIVDDEATIVKLFRICFSTAGYEVYSAQSAEEALSHLETTAIRSIFLDLNLPGMDGVELCRILKQENPSLKIFAITGYVALLDAESFESAGFDAFFKKPINMKTLLDAVAEDL